MSPGCSRRLLEMCGNALLCRSSRSQRAVEATETKTQAERFHELFLEDKNEAGRYLRSHLVMRLDHSEAEVIYVLRDCSLVCSGCYATRAYRNMRQFVDEHLRGRAAATGEGKYEF
jgi:hypothetical protein